MTTVEVVIEGLSALLMNRFPLDGVSETGGPKGVVLAREKAAERAAYRFSENGKPGNLYVPAENLRQSLVAAGSYEKGKGRATLAKLAAAALFVRPDALDLGTKKYEIDDRAVVIPSTKGRIIRHRPIISKWRLGFSLDYDDVLLAPDQVRRIVDHAGNKVGLLDFRPAKKGPFGRFMVTKWNDPSMRDEGEVRPG